MKRPMYVTIGGVQSVPRVMRGAPVFRPSMFDVPLIDRDLGADEIEMPEECARAGEIFLSPGVCGPDPRRPMDPYATPPVVVAPGSRISVKTPAAAAAPRPAVSTNLLILGGISVAVIYLLGRR